MRLSCWMIRLKRYRIAVIHSLKFLKPAVRPERSLNIKEAQLLLDDVISAVKKSYNDKQYAHQCIGRIGCFGSKMGFLYAMCCTPTRELMYQSIFTDLIVAHGNMWGVLGHSH